MTILFIKGLEQNCLDQGDVHHDGHLGVTIGEIALDGAKEENLSLVHPIFFVLDLDDLFDLLADSETGQGGLELDLGSDASRTELADGAMEVPSRTFLAGPFVEDVLSLKKKNHTLIFRRIAFRTENKC